MAVVSLKNSPGKKVRIPDDLLPYPSRARAYAVETGQATWEEVNGVPAVEPGVSGPFEAAMVQAGKSANRIWSNFRQAMAGGFGADQQPFIDEQMEMERLTGPVKERHPVASFAGEAMPFFAVPGGLPAQIGAGAAVGALEGDTAGERLLGAGVGAGAGFAGQKFGDFLGARAQNVLQGIRGVPEAGARAQLLRSGVPMSVSQRTSGPISKSLARFAERAQFVFTGRAPAAAGQERALTKILTETFNNPAVKKLNRQGMGRIVRDLQGTFRSAASRAGDEIIPDAEMIRALSSGFDDFQRVGSDSNQVVRIVESSVNEILDAYNNGRPVRADLFLKARSNLSEATTKADLETGSIVKILDAFDEQLKRIAPDLAEDLTEARDLWRLQLALRKGRALSAQGDVNLNTFNNNLKQYFRDFDIGNPLPRSTAEAGEVAAALNEAVLPFRSSGTAENVFAGSLPATLANNPGIIARTLSGAALPFMGGGTGGLLGGGALRGALGLVQRELPEPEI